MKYVLLYVGWLALEEKRKYFGEYYTPRPVVNFILNATNQILKDDFGRIRGFAEDEVTVLDPAIGTGTFLWIGYLLTFQELKNNGLGGLIRQKIRNHILKHFYGFEISITSYIIAHLKLTTLLEQWKYKLREDERIPVYLTNTLEQSESHGLMPFMRELSEESIKAGKIKQKPILVILGNPPYHGLSANKGKWITNLLKEGYTRADGSKDDGYYKLNGEPLGERNPKWLQDDYVKFIRFAQWKLDKAGEGILAFINNHAYIDNPTFRGMRQSLLESFNRIYILNLHGNARKKERCPDRSKDENVFNIRQGVAINIFVKNKKYRDKKVFYADLWGTRKIKFDWLDRFALDSPNWQRVINWQEVKPKAPYYDFTPQDYKLEEEYKRYWKITEIFPVNSVGIVTSRDKFVIDFNREKLEKRIELLTRDDILDDDLKQKFNLKDKKNWKLRKVRDGIKKENWIESITRILYRPFDIRWVSYYPPLIARSRKEIMHQMLKDNLGLITVRQVAEGVFNHAYVTQNIVESRITLSNKGIG